MPSNIKDINLYDLVPDSIRDDKEIKNAIDAVDGELKAVSNLCMIPALLSRIDQLDSKTLDHLAWQFDSKIWRDQWPINLKRSVIKSVILTKSKKGTRFAVKRSLENFGAAAVIREWHEKSPKGTPHTFDIIVSINDIEGQATEDIIKDTTVLIDDAKAARSTYNFSLALQSVGTLYFSGAARAAAYRRLDMTG